MLDDPISEIPLVFVDTETTGLNPRYGDRIVEIALARFRRGVMENFYESLVNPQRLMGPGVIRIHGITNQDVRDAPLFAEIAPRVCEEMSDAVIVAHNAPFDLGFISNEFRRAHLPIPNTLVLDTLTLLRRYFAFPSNSLRRVSEALGIRRNESHRALADALATQQVFDFIASDLQSRRGANTLGDFLKLQDGPIPWQDAPEFNVPLPPEVEEALRFNRPLFLRYRDDKGTITERTVSPIGVRTDHNIIYLRAYCHLRNGERHFRLDRIIELRLERE